MRLSGASLLLALFLGAGCGSGPPEPTAPAAIGTAPAGLRLVPRTALATAGNGPVARVEGPWRVNLAQVIAAAPKRPPASTVVPVVRDSRPELLIPEAEAERLRRRALRLAPDPAIQRMRVGLGALAPVPGTSWDSLDYTDNLSGSVPPDPELAAGPLNVIAVVNTSFEIYDKTGASVTGVVDFDAFMGAGCSGVFDPNALYDEESGKFFLGIDGDGDSYCFAVNATNNLLGTWNVYVLTTVGGSLFFDFPHVGVGDEAIFLGANIFQGVNFYTSAVWAIEKAPLVTGTAPNVVLQVIGAADGTPQPANLHGFRNGTWPPAGQPHYIMTEVYDGATHTVWSWDDPFGANNFSFEGDLDLAAASGVTPGFPVDVPQAGSASTVQANDWRGHQTEYRNGHLWTSQTISCNPGGGTVDCVRWAEIDPTGPSVVQAGVFASSGEYRFFPSLAADSCGDMAIGYSKGSTSIFPSTYATGRLFADAAGTVQAETVLQAGTIVYTAFDPSPRRWGDYTGMTVDPDGATFWYLGEYSKNTGTTNGRWGTFIGSFAFAGCAPTASLVAAVRSRPVSGGALVELETASEAATAGFRLYRENGDDVVEVTRGLLPAVDGAPQGGIYRILDPGAPGGVATYWVAEQQTDGRQLLHGPFRVRPQGSPAERTAVPAGNAARVSASSLARRSRAARARAEAGRGVGGPAEPPASATLPLHPHARALVRGRGPISLTASALAPALHLFEWQVRDRIQAGRLALERGGDPLPALAADDGSTLTFFAPGLDSLYTLDDVVRATVGAAATPMPTARVESTAPLPGGSFESHLAIEEDLFAATAATTETGVEYWYWKSVIAGDPVSGKRTFDLSIPDVASGQAQLTVRLVGAVAGPVEDEHGAVIRLNGAELGSTTWNDLERHQATFDLDASLLTPDAEIEVEGFAAGGATTSIFYVDGFEIAYPRYYRAMEDVLELSGDGNQVVTVDGFSSPAIRLFDVTDDQAPLRVTGGRVDHAGSYRLTFVPANSERRYLAIADGAIRSPERVEAEPASRLRFMAGADYLVLAPAQLLPAAEELAAYRQADGLTTAVLELREVYDEFRHGRAEPGAIRDFLAWARANWRIPPRYLVLAGAGTFDPRDLLGAGDNLLAPVLVGTPFGLAASDAWFADLDLDGLPEMAVGRIPALSNQELSDYVAKLSAAEGQGSGRPVLLLADDPDQGGAFPAQSDDVANELPAGIDQRRVYLSELTASEARQELFADWEQAPSLVNYLGHGGVERLASEGLLTAADVDELASTAEVVSAWTCVISRFEVPAFDSLGEALVMTPGRGAVVVIAPTGLSLGNQAHLLNRLYLQESQRHPRAGDALLEALRRFAERGADRSLLRVYTLLGDPAAHVD